MYGTYQKDIWHPLKNIWQSCVPYICGCHPSFYPIQIWHRWLQLVREPDCCCCCLCCWCGWRHSRHSRPTYWPPRPDSLIRLGFPFSITTLAENQNQLAENCFNFLCWFVWYVVGFHVFSSELSSDSSTPLQRKCEDGARILWEFTILFSDPIMVISGMVPLIKYHDSIWNNFISSGLWHFNSHLYHYHHQTSQNKYQD